MKTQAITALSELLATTQYLISHIENGRADDLQEILRGITEKSIGANSFLGDMQCIIEQKEVLWPPGPPASDEAHSPSWTAPAVMIPMAFKRQPMKQLIIHETVNPCNEINL